MKFHLSEEQLAIQDAVRGTLEDCWTTEHLHRFAQGDADMDRTSWDALMALGLGGLMVSEDHGGSGLGIVDAALVSEVLGETEAPSPVAAQMLAAMAIERSSNAAAMEHLPAIVAGEKMVTLAWGGNWLPDSWDATADEGTVRFVQSAGSADFFLLGTKGGGLDLVSAGDGVTIDAFQASDRARPLAKVVFAGAATETLFAPGDDEVAKIFDAALVLAAADALGGAQHCLDQSVAYAKEREQFGVAIGRFQALKHQLAQMALGVEPARALVWYAGYAQDADLPDARHAAATAKAHLCDRFVSVARDAVAAHGGIGYTWEYGLNYWFRRSLTDRAWLGGPTLHRARAADLAGW